MGATKQEQREWPFLPEELENDLLRLIDTTGNKEAILAAFVKGVTFGAYGAYEDLNSIKSALKKGVD